MKKLFSKMLCAMVVVVCILSALPATQSKAAVSSISGGYETKSSAYSWGSYINGKSVTITLPADQDDMWVKFTLPTQNRIYVRCSYNSKYEGMYTELYNSKSFSAIETAYSPENVINADTILPFLAMDCDNTTSSTQTYYVHVNRGSYEGNMYFSYTLRNRIKTGNGTFNFTGTASNAGNTGLSLSGVNSSVLSLNLTNNTNIPPNAIVTRVNTKGTQSPRQGNVHHMILPASSTSNWYTAKVSSATSGSYNISIDDNYQARQIWQFKYNVLSTAKSTMKSVSISLNWEYDIANTNYTIYSN